MHRSNPGVAYQGVPKAYSEAAAGKAYPDCQATPCDQFEVTFQEVELWIADRVVLPVETSLIGMFIALRGVVDHQALTPGLHSLAMAAVGITARS
uniref:Prephenate dehydratase domain-containing protein n=1 Tax=Brassica oleracea var. oleracea TaxID=109376 RepID=A0A0D3D5T9_BRAOL